MPLRILFADDSMTAQNMGKKILSEAGYDVVAVSNGAAAVKKIAEQKPDIIILDVYMPGYSGLEVCEKVRGSLDTLKTPVLLTVGKMEPYKPEDANRVKADGVIIKPFEATDLLAIVKKFEERIGSAPPPPMVAQTVAAEPEYVEEAVVTPAETVVDHHTSHGRPNSQPMVEVPDHMASSAAFGDFLGSEPANSTGHFAVNTPAATFETSVIVPAPPVPTAEIGVPAYEETQPDPAVAAVRASVETLPRPAPVESVPDFVATPVEAGPGPVVEVVPDAAIISPAPTIEAPHPQFIPVFKEPEEAREPEYAFMPTSIPAASDLEIPREPALQETAEETTRGTKVDHIEPGLMSTIGQQVEEFAAKPADAAVPEAFREEAIPSEEAAQQMRTTSARVIEAPAEVTDADFEARVAAAMSAYNQAAHIDTARAAVHEPSSVVADPAPVAEAAVVPEIDAVEPSAERALAAAAPIPSFEYQPPVQAVTAPAINPPPAYEPTAPHVEYVAPAVTNSLNVDRAGVAASVGAAIPEAAAAVAADDGVEHHHTIAQAVHRVMERLKPELVEEIMKELKSKK